MEKKVVSLVFRRLTYADFRHINKKGGEETGGGGQSYIDFPTRQIPLSKWQEFLGKKSGDGTVGPYWDILVHSCGLTTKRHIKIYQRRIQSVCIASQKIHSKTSNRVPSWHPDNDFPIDYNPDKQNLVIYIVKTNDGQYWAGWFLQEDITSKWVGNRLLAKLFSEECGYISFTSKIFIDTTNKEWPFLSDPIDLGNQRFTDEDLENNLVLEDTSPKLQVLIESKERPRFVDRLSKIRMRNNQIIKKLKNLYNGGCQIAGVDLTFKKKNGEYYVEGHHLIPLGIEGSDSYSNIIIVSPLIHKMLHYANVSEIDLTKIVNDELPIEINGEKYTIHWHPNHSKAVKSSLKG
ncbi:MAG: hypothetical protein LWX56_08705 [Ignavibacteria bacterium]|nr:hypothetical protein [Ignavibacteria bacterium]